MYTYVIARLAMTLQVWNLPQLLLHAAVDGNVERLGEMVRLKFCMNSFRRHRQWRLRPA